MANPVDISAVICTYNRVTMLGMALESLLAQETGGRFSYEVVVVDDASTDGTEDAVHAIQTKSPVPLHYVRGPGRGVAQARNCGIQAARGTWVAFTDDDQVNDPRWLLELHAVATETGAPCVGGSVALRLETEAAIPLTPVLRSILGEKMHAKTVVRQLMRCPGTGNVLFHHSVFDQVGTFCTDLAWGGEDAEFMLRVLDKGVVVWFAPESIVYHMIPPYRLEVKYFRWASRRVGMALAEVDYRVRGAHRLVMLCLARIAQALVINLPRLVVAALRRDPGRVIECRCLLWRASTYLRGTLHVLAPALFPQNRLREELLFRAERATMGKASDECTPPPRRGA